MAGPYPLATLGCTLTAAGITAPQYSDILASLKASAGIIFGTDIYLEADSQDGQLLAVFAKAIDDQNKAAIATYNSYSPTYAQGAALASLVKINGITVDAATKSTCPVVITGVAGTELTSCIIKDTAGNLWDLPGLVTIPPAGFITVTATAQQAGAIVSPIGTLTGIYTPVSGWQSVSNTVVGTPGFAKPTDAQTRQDQRDAVALPSQSIGGGILSAVRNVTGVGLAALYDNDTDTTDANGIPAHCIAVVVQGGAVQDIINAIGSRKTPGTNTQGDVTGFYTDPVAGMANQVNYWVLENLQAQVHINLTALAGFSETTNDLIAAALTQYTGTLGIGQTVYLSKLYGPANLYGDAATIATGLTQVQLDALSATYNITSITIGPYPGSLVAADLPITYIQLATLDPAQISFTVT